ncbi:uncharacterized protein LOC144710552 [Wolffia australiana]
MAQPHCKVCLKCFGSDKAVDGHMRVHTPEERGLVKKQLKKRAAFRLPTWATKKRRSSPSAAIAPASIAPARETSSALSIPDEAVYGLLELSRSIPAVPASGVAPPTVEMKPRSTSEETITAAAEERVEERPAAATVARRKKKTRTSAKPSGGEHRCSECSRVFLTGQALGGHMGKHRPPRQCIMFYNFLNVPA